MKRLLQVHLSDKCNLHCKHCYQGDIDHKQILNFEDYKVLLNQFKDLTEYTKAEGMVLNITGGEPLLIPNIINYIDYAISIGVSKINFLTNGLLLDKEIITELKKRKIVEVQVSIEGNKEVNDNIRGYGTYEKILQKIKYAADLGFPLKVSYTLNQLNYHCIETAIRDVKKAGAKMIWFDRIIPFQSNISLELSSAKFLEALNNIKTCKQLYEDEKFKILLKRSLQFLVDDNNFCYRCSGIVRSFTVIYDGTVYPCRRLPIALGNFKQSSLIDIYTAERTQKLMKAIVTPPDECSKCGYKHACRGGLKCLTYAKYHSLSHGDIHCPLKQNNQFSNINNIYLMLGNACNFHCKYCIQTSSCVENTQISDNLIVFLQQLLNGKNDKGKIRLNFWGGEPLLYFDVIVKFITIFGDKFNYNIVTNGSLLTEDMVKYFNKHNVFVVLSYDGENTDKIRDTNVLKNDKLRALFLSLNNKAICAVGSSKNYNYTELFKQIDNISKDIPLYVEPIKVTWNMPKELYNFNYIKLQEHLRQIANKAITDILAGEISRETNFFYPYIMRILRKTNCKLNCGQLSNVLNIDLAGNIYSCHNIDKSIGTIFSDYNDLIKQHNLWIENNTPDKCKNCEIYNFCKSVCPLENISETGTKITCDYYKVLYQETNYIIVNISSFLEKYLK